MLQVSWESNRVEMFFSMLFYKGLLYDLATGVTSSISEGDIFIYSRSAQLVSFEMESIRKEVNCAEHKYMNMSPPFIELATPLALAINISNLVFFSTVSRGQFAIAICLSHKYIEISVFQYRL